MTNALSVPTIPTGAHEEAVSHHDCGVGGPYSTSAHLTCDDQILAGTGDPNSCSAQTATGDHPAYGAAGSNSTHAHDSCDDHADTGVGGPNSHESIVGPYSTELPSGPPPALVSAAAQSGPTPPDAPIGTPPAMFAAARPEAPTPSSAPIGETSALLLAAPTTAPTPPSTPMSEPPATGLTACSEGPAPSAAPTPAPHATLGPVSLADPFLALAADVVDDLEKVRIANENRLRQLTRTEADADGEERGFGLTAEHASVARLALLVRGMRCDSPAAVDLIGKRDKKQRGQACCMEHDAIDALERSMRTHPLAPWVKAQKGVGEKQAARLLASINDPAWNNLTDDWRTLRQLYSYCGYGDAERQVRRRGEKANWDATAKMRVYLIAASCVQVGHGGQFRAVYDEGRIRYSEAVHETECKRCGPAGTPAQPGSPLSAGHRDGRARRLVCKAILREVWREARRLHGFDDDDASPHYPEETDRP